MRQPYCKQRNLYIVEQHAMGKPEMDIATELIMSVHRVKHIIREEERRIAAECRLAKYFGELDS